MILQDRFILNPEFIRGIFPESKIQNLKSKIEWVYPQNAATR